jgi:hypothetical protein
MTTAMHTPATPFTNSEARAIAAADTSELLAEFGRRCPEVDWPAMLATPPLEVWTPEDVAYALIDAGYDPDRVRRIVLAA